MCKWVSVCDWVNKWVNESSVCVCKCVTVEFVSAWVSGFVSEWAIECVSVWMGERVSEWVSMWVSKWVSAWVC